jgi:hypothetical protein
MTDRETPFPLFPAPEFNPVAEKLPGFVFVP